MTTSTKSKHLRFCAKVALSDNYKGGKPTNLFGDEFFAWALTATSTAIVVSLAPREAANRKEPILLGTLAAGKDGKLFAMLNTLIRARCTMKIHAMESVAKRTDDLTLEPVFIELNLSTGLLGTAIVGARFRGPEASKAVMKLKSSDAFSLRREPDNKHDPNAVLVSMGKLDLGYIPRTEAGIVSYLMDEHGIEPVVRLISPGASPRVRLDWS